MQRSQHNKLKVYEKLGDVDKILVLALALEKLIRQKINKLPHLIVTMHGLIVDRRKHKRHYIPERRWEMLEPDTKPHIKI